MDTAGPRSEQGLLSRLARGQVHLASGPAGARLAAALGGRNGLLFIDDHGGQHHEVWTGVREKTFELVARSPVKELQRALSPAALRDLFLTVRAFSLHPDPLRFVAGLSWEYAPHTRVFRLRELARARERSTPQTTLLLLDAARTLALALGARRMTAQTHAAFGRKLLEWNWRVDGRGTGLVVRLGAWLVRDRCYALELPERG